MKPLLTSLVERSVRNAVRDEPLPSRSADALDERGPGSAGLSTSPRGVVRPRLRSRHEPRPDGGRFDIATIEDMIARSPSRASDAFEPEMPQSQPDAKARSGDDVRHAPVHRGRSPGREIAVSGRGIERRPEPRADADALPQAEAAPISDNARTEPPRRDAGLPRVPRPAVPERLAPPQAIREDWTGHTASGACVDRSTNRRRHESIGSDRSATTGYRDVEAADGADDGDACEAAKRAGAAIGAAGRDHDRPCRGAGGVCPAAACRAQDSRVADDVAR